MPSICAEHFAPKGSYRPYVFWRDCYVSTLAGFARAVGAFVASDRVQLQVFVRSSTVDVTGVIDLDFKVANLPIDQLPFTLPAAHYKSFGHISVQSHHCKREPEVICPIFWIARVKPVFETRLPHGGVKGSHLPLQLSALRRDDAASNYCAPRSGISAWVITDALSQFVTAKCAKSSIRQCRHLAYLRSWKLFGKMPWAGEYSQTSTAVFFDFPFTSRYILPKGIIHLTT
jgi:hypothetical protein